MTLLPAECNTNSWSQLTQPSGFTPSSLSNLHAPLSLPSPRLNHTGCFLTLQAHQSHPYPWNFILAGPYNWNAFLLDPCMASSFLSFRVQIKSSLLREAFSDHCYTQSSRCFLHCTSVDCLLFISFNLNVMRLDLGGYRGVTYMSKFIHLYTSDVCTLLHIISYTLKIITTKQNLLELGPYISCLLLNPQFLE